MALTKIRNNGLASDAGNGFIHLNTFTVTSGAGTVDLTLDVSTYSNFKLLITDLLPDTNSVNLRHRVSTDGGSTYLSTSIYGYNNLGRRAAGSLDSEDSNADSNIKFNVSETMYGNLTDEAVSGEITFLGLDQDDPKVIAHLTNKNVSANYSYCYINGAYFLDGSSTPVNAIRFYFSSGNFAQGTFKLYGIAS